MGDSDAVTVRSTVLNSRIGRRTVLATGALVPLLGFTRAPHSASTLSASEGDAVLALARLGAVYPIAFPSFGEAGRASDRATRARLTDAFARASTARRAAALRGARTLLAAGVSTVDARTLRTTLAGLADDQFVHAATAVAIATVSTRFDPNSDRMARIWLDGIRRSERTDFFTAAVMRGSTS